MPPVWCRVAGRYRVPLRLSPAACAFVSGGLHALVCWYRRVRDAQRMGPTTSELPSRPRTMATGLQSSMRVTVVS